MVVGTAAAGSVGEYLTQPVSVIEVAVEDEKVVVIVV